MTDHIGLAAIHVFFKVVMRIHEEKVEVKIKVEIAAIAPLEAPLLSISFNRTDSFLLSPFFPDRCLLLILNY